MLCTNLGKFVKHTESSKVQLVLQYYLEQKQVFINLRHQVTCHIQVFINILLRHQVICSGNLIIQLNSFYFIYICTFEAWQYSLSNGVSRRDYDGSKS